MTDYETIMDFFKDCGKIISIRAPKYQDTGRLRSKIFFWWRALFYCYHQF